MSISCLDIFDLKNITENSSFKPKTKKNITFIVGAVVIKNGKVLMIQEAKASCRGTWYLPAGRLEENESFEEGVKREVTEESGYNFTPTTVICLETNSDIWWRITFTGECNSGELKTKADDESLRADWLEIEMVINGGSKEFPLRCSDICKLVQTGKEFQERFVTLSSPPYNLLPVESDCLQALYLRLVFATGDLPERKGYVLLLKNSRTLPVLNTHPRKNHLSIMYDFAKTLFEEQDLRWYFSRTTSLPILDIAFNGHGSVNGLMVTFLLLNSSRKDSHALSQSCPDEYEWASLSDVLPTSETTACSHALCSTFFHAEHPQLHTLGNVML